MAHVSSSSSLANVTYRYLEQRWNQGQYVPLATELKGICQIAHGVDCVYEGGILWILDHWNNLDSPTPRVGRSAQIIMLSGGREVRKGFANVLYVPVESAKAAYNLTKRSIEVLR
jgi:hypothetical protein